MDSCYAPLSHSTANWRFVFRQWQAIKAVSCERLTPARVRFFNSYINWIGKCSQADECATIGNCKISRVLFDEDLVLLSFTGSVFFFLKQNL